MQAINARLNAGIAVVLTDKTRPYKLQPIPRPDWLAPPKPQVKTVTLEDLFHKFQS